MLRLWADASLAKKNFGHEPLTSFDEGLSHLHGWYLQNTEKLEEMLKAEKETNWIP